MRIKKVSITGFKSFMDRIDILFPFGISAVVGPNGCGKSNIVDAIRWAMGEQSAKQLRGRHMEDIIFNGAGEFKPLGMAEVSIVLENGDGSFPSEFANESEISVTRRLYRSGESEYLLNNVPCRLKDIQDIFMDTGLGNKAYSIIGQGMIGSIVEQKPEETRMMLEEASGITRFKKKEAESRRKMELTNRNLQRVEDILVEVEGQMRSLKRQAAKARRFKAIGLEIQRLELMLNANAYHDLEDESGNRIKSTDDLVRQEIALTTDFSGIQAKIETMNMELEEKDREIASLRNNYLEIKDEFNKKESALESIAGEKRMQVELENRLNNEKADISKQLLTLEKERTGLVEKVGKLKQDSVAMEDEISIVENRMKGRKELSNEIREEYERISAKIGSDAAREAGLNQESTHLNKRIEEITDNRERLEKEKGDVRLKIDNLLELSQKKNEIRQALAVKLKDIEGEILEKKRDSEELEKNVKSLEGELKSKESELNIHRTRLSSLISLNENFEGYQIGVRTIMKAQDLKPKNEGHILGLVADFLQVEPRYEQAAEAVLADKLQYIIVQDQEDGKEAVDYLKSKARGRGSFVSLNDLKPKEDNGKSNGFPLLRELITVSESYKPVIDTLLGDTALAGNLDEAISAWRSNGKDSTLVTPDGDLIDKNGIISGGRLANGPNGPLTRKREIKDLMEKVAKYSKDVERSKARLEKVYRETEEKKNSLNLLVEERADCQDKLNDLDKVIFRLSHELDQDERLSERISKELEDNSKAQARHRDELNKIESELSLCMEKKRKQEEYLLRKRLELKESEQEFDETRNELERLKMEYNLSIEEKKGIAREIERIDNFSEEYRNRLEKIAQDIIAVHESSSEYIKREEVLREEIKGFYDTLRQAEEGVNLAQQVRNNFHAEIREEEKNGATLREEIDLLKEKINRARMEQSEIKFKMDNLAQIVKERFNLDLVQVYKDYLVEGFSAGETRERLEHQKRLRERLGDVNLTAIQEHEALKERYDFIQGQRQDLLNSIDSIMQAIRKINKTCLERFMSTFEETDKKLKQVFPILFNGGTAGLKLTDEKNPLECGVLVEVQPPGKKLSHMGLLSGGEKALVAMALLFAIYLIKPSPFCLLDEVDAPLDEANIDRFNNLLKEIKKYSQILIVTHNRRSMEIVDSLFGVTMENAGISKMVSVQLNGQNLN
jgi:chromosome segregation protein